MSEGNGEHLPAGWTTARVGDLVELVNGYAFKPAHWKETGLPIVRIQNLNDPDAPFNRCPDKLPEKIVINDGDLLFAWSGTPGTSFGAHIWNRGKAYLNQHIFKVTFDESRTDKRFLQLAINQNLTEYIRAAHGGAGLAHITKGKFEGSTLLLPPLGEQRRIVEKIDELFSDLDKGAALLKRVRLNFDRYRASVLKAAVEGKLTAKWRRNRADVEPASELLKRILEERRRRWEESQLAKFEQAKKQPSKNWKERYEEPESPRNGELPPLPEGWCWATIDQCITEAICNGISVKGSLEPPGVPALRLSAMSDAGFDYEEIRYIPIDESTSEDLAVREGDFFVSRGNGSIRLVGRGTVAQPAPRVIVFPDTMMRVRFHRTMLQSGWIPAIWASSLVRRQIEGRVKTTAGIWKIAQPQLASICVPLPPLVEQHELVRLLRAAADGCHRLGDLIHRNEARAGSLKQSILRRAFSGRLVPQDPTEEPVSLNSADPTAERNSRQSRRRREAEKVGAPLFSGPER